MLITKEVTVNFNSRGAPIVLDAVQGDSGRGVVIHCMSAENPWQIPEDAAILIQYCCADNTGGVYDTLPDGQAAYCVEDNAITIYLAPAVCAVGGTTKLQVTIMDQGVQLTTFHMDIRVQPNVQAGLASGDYTNLAQWLESNGAGGTTGAAGHTPIKGVDYYTEADKAEMVDAVIAKLPNGDEVGY